MGDVVTLSTVSTLLEILVRLLQLDGAVIEKLTGFQPFLRFWSYPIALRLERGRWKLVFQPFLRFNRRSGQIRSEMAWRVFSFNPS